MTNVKPKSEEIVIDSSLAEEKRLTKTERRNFFGGLWH